MSVVVKGAAGPLLVTKGAPKSVFDACTSYERDGEVRALDAAASSAAARRSSS